MPDRVIRDEILESDRWLDLPSDSARLAYIGLLLCADSFGNMEYHERRMYRFLHGFTQIKKPEDAALLLEHLLSADLIRIYKKPLDGEERQFIHLPRTKFAGGYMVQYVPPSPWCNPDALLGKTVRQQRLAKNITITSQEHSNDVSTGVGVGVDVGVGESKNPMSDKSDGEFHFNFFWEKYPRKEAKKKARQAWDKLKLNSSESVAPVMHGLAKAKESDQWRRGIIPHASSWLNGRRFEDQLPEAKPMTMQW